MYIFLATSFWASRKIKTVELIVFPYIQGESTNHYSHCPKKKKLFENKKENLFVAVI